MYNESRNVYIDKNYRKASINVWYNNISKFITIIDYKILLMFSFMKILSTWPTDK